MKKLDEWETKAQKALDDIKALKDKLASETIFTSGTALSHALEETTSERFVREYITLISIVRKQHEALKKGCSCWGSKEDAQLLIKAGHTVTYCHACETGKEIEEMLK